MLWLDQFLSGGLVLGLLMAGLVFFRFFRKTRDRLFAMFGVAFWIMAVNQCALAVVGEALEAYTVLYLVRFVAFLVILVAILDKNLEPGRKRRKALREEEPPPGRPVREGL